MKKIFRMVFWIVGGLLILLIAGGLIFINNVMGKYDEGKYLARLDSAGVKYEMYDIPFEGGSIRSARIGPDSLPKVLLIHGSPGHWVDWINILTNEQLKGRFCLIAFDRPGYGGTSIGPQAQLSEQARAAGTVMKHFSQGDERYMVAGHSYGGGVCQQVLIDYPAMTSRGIYAGGTLSPEVQKPKWYNQLGRLKLVQWLIPDDFISSNHEMMGLQQSLLDAEQSVPGLNQSIVMIHGKKDVLVDFKTVAYYQKLKPTGVDYVLDDEMNHFIPWSHPHLVVEAILKP